MNATNIMVYYLVKLQVEKVICIVVKNLQYAMLQQYDTIFLWKSTHSGSYLILSIFYNKYMIQNMISNMKIQG